MSKVQLILGRDDIARQAIEWIRQAKPGSRVTLEEPRRSDHQNRRLWAMLGDVAEQAMHDGVKLDAETWKCLFMHSLGQETRFVRSLDGKTFLPIGQRSSKLTVQQMCDLQELIAAYCAERGIKLLEDYRMDFLDSR
jgi:NinB protein